MENKSFFKLTMASRLSLLDIFMKDNKLGIESFRVYSRKGNAYSNICSFLKIKDTQKNRKRLYNMFQQNYDPNVLKCSTPKSQNFEEMNINDISVIDHVSPTKSPDSEYITEKSSELSLNLTSEARNSYITPTVQNFSVSSVINITHSSIQHNVLLPHNSINIFDLSTNLGNSFLNCSVLEGSFKLGKQKTDLIIFGKKPKYENYILREKMKLFVNNICTVTVHHKRANKTKKTIYLKCIHPLCKLFKMQINESGDVLVYSSNKNFNHLINLTGQVRGIERVLVKKQLLNKKALKYKIKTLNELNEDILKRRNLQTLKSDTTIRKIRSEALSDLDRDKDDFLDVLKMRHDHPEYIKVVSDPFQVQMFSLEQLDILKIINSSSKEPTILHFDATGSIVRKTENAEKKCFYYCGVIRTPNGRVCPILELLSGQHDQVNIGFVLGSFKIFVEKNYTSWPPFRCVVTDFSFALINSICLNWNHMTLQNYLQTVYGFIEQHQTLPKNIIILKICCAHFTKILIKLIDSEPNTNEKHLKEILVAPLNMKNYEVIKLWFQYLVTLLNSKFVTNHFKNCYNNLVKLCINSEQLSQEELFISRTESLGRKKTSKFAKSPFYKDFLKIFKRELFKISKEEEHLRKTSSENLISNRFFYPKILNKLLKSYIPYLPLWSGLLNMGRLSNAPVENWNNTLKNNILENQKDMKCSRVIRKIREYVTAVCREASIGIDREGLCLKKRKRKNDFLTEEKWKRKKIHTKHSKPYHQMECLKKMHVVSKQDCENDLKDDPEQSHRSWRTINVENDVLPVSGNTKGLCLLRFPNGLVQDVNYYIPNFYLGDYIVAYYNSQYYFKISDYDSIDKNIGKTAYDTLMFLLGNTSCMDLDRFSTMSKIEKLQLLATFGKFEENIDAADIVKKLKLTVLSKSIVMEKSCLKCGFESHDYAITQWVECNSCLRWTHFKCLGYDTSNSFFHNKIYKCPLCKLYLNYEMAQYQGDSFEACQFKSLYYQDYACLFNSGMETEMWLNNFLIDLIIGCFLKNKSSFSYLNCNLASHLFHSINRDMSEEEFSLFPKTAGTLFIPLNVNQNHWCLIIVDNQKHVFSYINPQEANSPQNTQHYFDIYKKILARTSNENLKKWRTRYWPHDIQKDSFNCGVYILFYIQQISNGDQLFGLNTAKFRSYLQNFLLEQASVTFDPPPAHPFRKI